MEAKPIFNILVVEDDSDVATELVECLELMGHRAEWSVAQASLRIAQDCDLVLLDLGLGEIDGFQVLDQIALAAVRPPVAIMSGRDVRFMESASDLARSLGLRPVGMLHKPFAPRQLSALLEGLDTAPVVAAAPAHTPGLTAASTEPYYAFQYKNDLQSGLPVGCEVLVRLPGVLNIEAWFAVLDTQRALAMTVSASLAAIDLHQRLAAQGQKLTVAFNCPPDIFSAPDLLGSLKRSCHEAGVSPAHIAIELTEQKGSGALVDVASMACRYALAGFPVHLDDFGTGTASLEHLLKLPLTEVKIDRKVFRSLVQDGRALLHEIAALCRANGITSTVEGIETQEDVIIAREAGADYGQGFLWSRPSPIADLPDR
jgi:EAL domain-containing protein (putative c-di-GMP-specific phosphodiesterase class I)